MSGFWVTEPVNELLHRRGATDIAIYPTVVLWNDTGYIANGGIEKGSVDPDKVLTFEGKKYTLAHVRKMVEWMHANCTAPASFSERYGSFYFVSERDRVMFRLFFSDDTMPFDL